MYLEHAEGKFKHVKKLLDFIDTHLYSLADEEGAVVSYDPEGIYFELRYIGKEGEFAYTITINDRKLEAEFKRVGMIESRTLAKAELILDNLTLLDMLLKVFGGVEKLDEEVE